MTVYGIVSDLHLEFRDMKETMIMSKKLRDALTKCDYLLIAGDIHQGFASRQYFLESFAKESKDSKRVIHILGNHDFYQGEWENTPVLRHRSANVIGHTLWTNFENDNPMCKLAAMRYINDFKCIFSRRGDALITPNEMILANSMAMNSILASDLEVVLTHFPPTRDGNTLERYKANVDGLNGYFMNSFEEKIINSDKKLWVFGHIHSVWDYMVGNCRMVSNPLGYPNEIYQTIDDYEVKFVTV
jgi:Icc-related predicted phosphoesterase